MIYDISMAITEAMQVYKNNPAKKPLITAVSNFSNGQVYESLITMNMHTGTHVDYPLHMIENGETSDIEDISRLVTKAKVVDLSHLDDVITVDDLKSLAIDEGDFLLFKTKNSFSEHFLFDFIYLSETAAAYLRSKKIAGVGTDGLGIERAQKDHPTHKILLGNNIIIIEGLRLKKVPEGTYDMVCLPLKIPGVEATPARVILQKK